MNNTVLYVRILTVIMIPVRSVFCLYVWFISRKREAIIAYDCLINFLLGIVIIFLSGILFRWSIMLKLMTSDKAYLECAFLTLESFIIHDNCCLSWRIYYEFVDSMSDFFHMAMPREGHVIGFRKALE